MQPWLRNAIFMLVTLIILLISGYFLFSKFYKITKIPQIQENVEVKNTLPNEKESIPDIIEPVVLTPKKDVIIPIPEPTLPEGTDRFIVSLTATNEIIADNLLQAGFITDSESFVVSLNKEKTPTSPGAYKLSKEMNVVQIDKVLHGKPYMKWVVIKEGLRKEEIASILANTLGWTSKQKSTWILKDTTTSPEYIEGVYYPDTYLIPIIEEPALTAKRMIAKFNENFSPFLSQFTAKNIKWARALTLASIVQREAANDNDMPLISGILWNRLNENMALGVDATLQYIRGDVGKGWWAPISVADKQIDSPYNTYKYKGLPPHPISNPGIPAIEAVLNPTTTDCLYYLHDKNRVTHCSVTYEEHLKNIQKYLVENTTSSN